MSSPLPLLILGFSAVFGLLFLARSIRRLCQGAFLSSLAAFVLAVVLFSFSWLGTAWLMANAKNPEVIAAAEDAENERQTEEPQPSPAR